jgi:hypothetical protein
MTQQKMTRHPFSLAIALGWVLAGSGVVSAADMSKEELIKDALSAAPPAVQDTAKVTDEHGNVLREGTSAYTCMATPEAIRHLGSEPMCLDQVWFQWADAWINKKPFSTDRVGIGYMLGGDAAGASNIDPFATEPTADNQWVVEGPHVMIIVPDPAQLEGLPDTPTDDGAYVMWKGTPYVHIMVPVGSRPEQRAVSN